MAQLLEAMMLLAFSIGWYFSIYKMLKTGTAEGKSLRFVTVICSGYFLGLMAKLAEWFEGGTLDIVAAIYAWNLVVTMFDGWLVWRLTAGRQLSLSRKPLALRETG